MNRASPRGPEQPGFSAQAVAPPKIPNMVAVASGKGGVGKTWFAITLASVLAKAGRRVLLFDADLGLANVHIQLGHAPEHDLGSVIAGRIPLAKAASTVPEAGFDVIAGRSGSGSLANLPANRLVSLRSALAGLAQRYDVVLLDLGAGVERSVRMISGQAALHLVVTNDEPTSLTDAYAFIKLTSMFDPQTDIRLVVNLAETAREGEQTYFTLLKACQEFLKIEPGLAGIIRRDQKVKEAIRHQQPLIVKAPKSKAVADVVALARRIPILTRQGGGKAAE